MVGPTTERVALMSIKPEYAQKLLSGTKRVEFRRMAPREHVGRVLVYATQPVGALVGILEITGVERASPDQLWRKYRSVAGIAKGKFFEYFHGVEEGDALVVGRVWALTRLVALGSAGLDSRPPQSFRYVDGDVLGKLAQDCTERFREGSMPSNSALNLAGF